LSLRDDVAPANPRCILKFVAKRQRPRISTQGSAPRRSSTSSRPMARSWSQPGGRRQGRC